MTSSGASTIEQHTQERKFFFAYASFLLLIVIVGFAPSLFKDLALQGSEIPAYLHLHGAILVGWFLLLVAQAWLIRTGTVQL
ncbi:MAG: hypothetical protein ACR2QR_06460, partial [Woeseiaceae bacterium]